MSHDSSHTVCHAVTDAGHDAGLTHGVTLLQNQNQNQTVFRAVRGSSVANQIQIVKVRNARGCVGLDLG